MKVAKRLIILISGILIIALLVWVYLLNLKNKPSFIRQKLSGTSLEIYDFLHKQGEFTPEKMAEKIIQPIKPIYSKNTINTLGLMDSNPRVEGWLFDYYQMNDDYLLLVVGFDSKDGNRFVTPIEIPLYLYAGYEPAQLVFSLLGNKSMESSTTAIDDSGDVDKILENVAMLKGGPIVFNLKNKPSPEEWYHKYGEPVDRNLKEADNKIILNKALTARLVNNSGGEDLNLDNISSIENIDLIELTKLEDIKNVDITQVPLIYSQIYFFRN